MPYLISKPAECGGASEVVPLFLLKTWREVEKWAKHTWQKSGWDSFSLSTDEERFFILYTEDHKIAEWYDIRRINFRNPTSRKVFIS